LNKRSFIKKAQFLRGSAVFKIAVTVADILFVEFMEQKDSSGWHDCSLFGLRVSLQKKLMEIK